MNTELEKQLEALIGEIKNKEDFEKVKVQLLKRGIESLLKAEMTAHLGFGKGDSVIASNQRNGFSEKTIKTQDGEQRIKIPRDRESSFEPVVVPKHQSISQELEDCIQLLYAKGMSNSDIIDFIESAYGVHYSTSQVSIITNQLLEDIKLWQNRPLEDVYPIIWIDAIHYKIRQEGKVISKACMIVLGVNTEGQKDSRIKLYNRPENYIKGANACRNFGYENCIGDYINWFDSDDIMDPAFIQKKVETLEKEQLDFVISQSVNFDDYGQESVIFEKENKGKKINAENFIGNVINWITMDVMVTRQSVGEFRFNEKLQSGQEYNFYSRYLLNKPKGKFIYQCLAKRRIHNTSIQQELQKDKIKHKKELLFNEIVLLKDIKGKVSKKTIKRSLKRMMRFSYETQNKFRISKIQGLVLKELIIFGNLKAIVCYMFWMITNLIFGKGYLWIKLSNFE